MNDTTQATPPRLTRRRAPLSLKQRILRRVMMIVPMAALVFLVGRMGWLDQAADKLTFSRTSWFDNTAVVEHFRTIVTHNGMTSDAKDCLLFVINGNDPPDATRLEVLEKHSGKCPGDRNTLPHLFTIQIDRLNQTAQTDWQSPGMFHPLPR
ncbi:hypothetical protein [Komagataeibacter saccharivorans]|uniref:Uncharacterized protein n=1 Tax=Komagataeibacter saccharivorans TaxID=265959 RepID=A0A347WDF4_9PROT|nr:hypothetical protein [Komagataeibacter saccharivorans]AXY22897.1 hypothetical protein CD178_02144 [Komagataeibacter saccharivorans]PYD50222.1 hypothetical protein CFR79_10425 [Komagataeibacter saccharivorans]QBL93262.1 hypothetical protein KSAC_10220 [Komagataeibacter saccharivorans]GBQ41449.1 hypothetical protein AA0614_2319 [Komagataeibacter saccharivorans NRIC 0614]